MEPEGSSCVNEEKSKYNDAEYLDQDLIDTLD